MLKFNIDPDAFYETKEVAEILQLKPITMYIWNMKGKLRPHKKIGTKQYYLGQDLLDFIEDV